MQSRKPSQVVIPVSEASQIGEIRRRTNQLAADAGLKASECGNASIIATELATNLTRHATGGEMILICGQEESHGWFEAVALDRGPGISDVSRCLGDGFSTAGGPGNGLGAVCRLSSEWDVFSATGSDASSPGSVIFARVAEKTTPSASRSFTWGSVSKPAPQETRCGDTWRVAERPGELTLMVADGLGHGPSAADAAEEAGDVFDHDPFAPLPTFLQNAGVRMQQTRGGAVAAARIDARTRNVKFVGVGNISGHLRARGEDSGRGLVSHNGVVGGIMSKVQEFEYPCPEEGLLVLHSDGLQTRWNLQSYAGLQSRHPAVIAAVLYRDFTRGRDDVTVTVVRFSLASMSP